MKITLNGKEQTINAQTTLKQLLEQTLKKQLNADGTATDGSKLGIAVAINNSVIPRPHWATLTLKPENHIEIITAVQGG